MWTLVEAVANRITVVVIPIAILGFLAAVSAPSLLILGAVGLYAMIRRLGTGSELGSAALAGIDRLFFASLLLVQGVYASLCSGVAFTGLLTTALLTGAYVALHRCGEVAPGKLAHSVVAFAWMMVIYRWFAPLWPWWCCHLVNNVG